MSNQTCGNCDHGWITERQETVAENGQVVYMASLRKCDHCQGTGKPPGVL